MGTLWGFRTGEKGMPMTRMFRWMVLILVATLWGCDSGYSEFPIVGEESASRVAYSRPAINKKAPAFRSRGLPIAVLPLIRKLLPFD
jgi:hypothetical protein